MLSERGSVGKNSLLGMKIWKLAGSLLIYAKTFPYWIVRAHIFYGLFGISPRTISVAPGAPYLVHHRETNGSNRK
jgi:hypothetical protein